jgi:hypothetical protein
MNERPRTRLLDTIRNNYQAPPELQIQPSTIILKSVNDLNGSPSRPTRRR